MSLRPVLRPVVDAGDFDCVIRDLVYRDIRQWREDQLSASRQADALASQVGKVLQHAAAVVNGLGNAARCRGVVALNPCADSLQIFGRGQRPPDIP